MRAAVVLGLMLAVPAWAEVFEDVPFDHWANDAVRDLAAAGILQGKPDGKFHGEDPVTRYELALALERTRQSQHGGPLARLLGPLLGHVSPKPGLSPDLGGLLGRSDGAKPPAGDQFGAVRQLLEKLLESAFKAWTQQGPEGRQALRGLLGQALKGVFDLWQQSDGPMRDQLQSLIEDTVGRLMKLWAELDGEHRAELEGVLGDLMGQAMAFAGEAGQTLRPMLDELGRGVADRAMAALSGVDPTVGLPFLQRLADKAREAAAAAGLPLPGEH
jgi:hypothetical protein